MKTLLIVSHPYPEQSQVIQALQQTAASLPNVTVRNLETLYGHDTTAFDVAAEQQAHEGVERVVYLFPIHWFNLTPMLKAYLNQVWSYGWAFGPEGHALRGKQMQVVVSAGALPSAADSGPEWRCSSTKAPTAIPAATARIATHRHWRGLDQAVP